MQLAFKNEVISALFKALNEFDSVTFRKTTDGDYEYLECLARHNDSDYRMIFHFPDENSSLEELHKLEAGIMFALKEDLWCSFDKVYVKVEE